ncbi:MAG TPA: LacI family DNA-binding transcriptional regulator [Hyphomonadaceae bacterium]
MTRKPKRAKAETISFNGKRPTINDVARLARVSKKTVSRIINKSPFVKEKTRERVEALIKEIGYTPDPMARGLASKRSFLVGLIYDQPNPQYVIDMQQGILDVIRGSGFELLVHPCRRQAPDFLQNVRAFVERQKLAGVVLPPSVSEDDALVEILQEFGCPYVRIASVPLDEAEHSIVTHDAEGAQEAAEHLAGLGHTRIAHVSGPDTFRSAHERRAGFVKGLKAHKLKLERELDIKAAYTFQSGVDAGRRLMALSDPPTAIFCGNDEMAAGVCQAVREAGYEIGKHVSVVGFDDSPLASRLWPALTTVVLPIRLMGRMASTRLLGESLIHEPPQEETLGEVHPKLVVRGSTGAARA